MATPTMQTVGSNFAFSTTSPGGDAVDLCIVSVNNNGAEVSVTSDWFPVSVTEALTRQLKKLLAVPGVSPAGLLTLLEVASLTDGVSATLGLAEVNGGAGMRVTTTGPCAFLVRPTHSIAGGYSLLGGASTGPTATNASLAANGDPGDTAELLKLADASFGRDSVTTIFAIGTVASLDTVGDHKEVDSGASFTYSASVKAANDGTLSVAEESLTIIGDAAWKAPGALTLAFGASATAGNHAIAATNGLAKEALASISVVRTALTYVKGMN